MYRYGILEFPYCASSKSRRYFHVLRYIVTTVVFSRNSMIMNYFSQDGIFMSWLYIILIKRVFSCLDQDGIFLCDPYWVYRGFSTGSKLNLTFIWSSEITQGDTLIKSFNQSLSSALSSLLWADERNCLSLNWHFSLIDFWSALVSDIAH